MLTRVVLFEVTFSDVSECKNLPCSSLLAAARSVLEVEPESMEGVPGRLLVLELPAEPRPAARLGGVRFF